MAQRNEAFSYSQTRYSNERDPYDRRRSDGRDSTRSASSRRDDDSWDDARTTRRGRDTRTSARSESARRQSSGRGNTRGTSPARETQRRDQRPDAQRQLRRNAPRNDEAQSGGRPQAAASPRRVTSIDGFRALAIIAVFLYHLDVAWLPSGHLGVVMFLVLTGYLATSSLLRKLRDGAGAIPNFWFKRLARIWPSTVVMIAFTVLTCIICNHVLLTKAKPDVIPGIGLYENISYILRNVSYFEQIGGPSPLTHLWYLGVDVQFNLVWPLIMLLGYAVLPSRAASRRLALLLAVISAVAMGVLYNPDSGVTRVYYGTDTRAFAPLVGAWLAYALPLGRRPARDVRYLVEDHRVGFELLGLLSLVGLVLGMVFVPDTSVLLYRGGMMLAALLSVAVIATLVLPGGLLSSILSLPPLQWLGSRSFGAYLWHFPLIQLFGAAKNTAPWWKLAAVAILTLILAELSYRLIEQPAGGLLRGSTQGRPADKPSPALGTPVLVGALLLALVGVGDAIGMALIPDETLVPEEAIVSTGEASDKAMDLTKLESDKDTETVTEVEQTEPPKDIPASEAVLHAPAAEKQAGMYDPVLIGDSVPGDAEAYWREACPDGLLDSYVGRRPDEALNVLDQYLEMGVVGKIVIIQAFSNTPVTMAELDHMIAACGSDRIIYLVNVRIPESEQEQINNTISEGVAKYDNVHLINWHALSEGQSDWLYADGEHLTPTGQPIYVNMLVEAIKDDFVANGGTVTRKGEATSDVDTGASHVVDTYPTQTETTSEETTSEESTGETSEMQAASDGGTELRQANAQDGQLRILMLGNSFTSFNDLPSKVADVTGGEVVSHTKGGAHLAELYDPDTEVGSSTIEDIEQGTWDYVVLQEMSTVPMDNTEEYFNSISELVRLIREHGGEPIIYATWAYDTTKYGAKSHGITMDQMDDELQSSFQKAAATANLLVANVGKAFSDTGHDESLYADDGKHPSEDGSLLAANVIAQTIDEDTKSA